MTEWLLRGKAAYSGIGRLTDYFQVASRIGPRCSMAATSAATTKHMRPPHVTISEYQVGRMDFGYGCIIGTCIMLTSESAIQ